MIRGKVTIREATPDAIRGAAILLVVAIHAFAYLGLPTTEGGAWRLTWLAVSQIAVPVFFLVDGWLLARRPPPQRPLAWLAETAWRLLLPWALFSALFLALRLAAEAAGSAGGPPVLAAGPGDLPLALWWGTAAGHLYFLPALLLTRAAGLLLLPLLGGCRRPVAAAGLAACLILGWRLGLEPLLPRPERGVDPLLAACTGLGFVALGWALAAIEAARAGAAGKVAGLAALALAGLATGAADGLPAGGAVAESLAATLGQASYLLAAWWAAGRLRGTLARGAAWLGQRTMEIYLLHGLPVRLLAGVALSAALPGPVALAGVIAGGTAAALAAAWLARRLGLGWTWNPPPPGALGRGVPARA